MVASFYLNPYFRKSLFIAGVLFCLSPLSDPPLALLLGLLFSQTIGHPFKLYNASATKFLLQFSIVGLGFGMNLYEALSAGRDGLLFTVASITLVLTVGVMLGRLLHIDKKTAYLISSGTAICGGSAIAAIAPIVKADENQISVSLGIIFILNSVALFVFPAIGHLLHLSQAQFGLWAAIAIHDTSSVVGAAQKYGLSALHIATTVKLERTLWIIPVSFMTAFLFNNRSGKIKMPFFILLFVLAMVFHTFIPHTSVITDWFVVIAKKGMTLTLFLIGTGLTREALKSVGWKPLLSGLILWVLISVSSISVIMLTIKH
jgi:uncharacterized integral membrane protein (TIGR00698 family)